MSKTTDKGAEPEHSADPNFAPVHFTTVVSTMCLGHWGWSAQPGKYSYVVQQDHFHGLNQWKGCCVQKKFYRKITVHFLKSGFEGQIYIPLTKYETGNPPDFCRKSPETDILQMQPTTSLSLSLSLTHTHTHIVDLHVFSFQRNT